MKICFSTLGCPEWSWKDILAVAKDLGYDGVEIRGIGNEIYVPKAKPFLPERLEDTKSQLRKKGIDIPCLTSSCFLHHENRELYLEEGKEYIDVAANLGARYVRVLGDSEPQPQGDVDEKQVEELLMELGDYAAQKKDVVVLLETNGVFADSKKMAGLMDRVKHPNIGVLWDIHHPYRFMGESMRETYTRLKDYIHHVHVKDSLKDGDRIRYCLLGEGDLPVKEALTLLQQGGYKGYISLEWVKRWYFDLEEPGIVFSHFINTVKEMLQS